MSQQLSNAIINSTSLAASPSPSTQSSFPPSLRWYLSIRSGSSASCSVSRARLLLHFCNNGPADTSGQFNEITHLISVPISESTFSEARASLCASPKSSGSLSSSRILALVLHQTRRLCIPCRSHCRLSLHANQGLN